MKIVPKLTTALVAGTCAILGANGVMRVRRERRFYEADRIRDHETVGRALEAAAAAVWKLDGEQAAVRSIEAVSRHSTTLRIRWIPLSQGPSGALDLDPAALQPLSADQPLTVARPAASREVLWKTYVPLDVDGVRRGLIELTEPAASEDRFVRGVVVDTTAMTAALMVLSAVLVFVMGQWLIGTPVRLLSEKARRIGRGDFTGPVVLPQRDELADLAREINATCDRLSTTLEQLRHADRLATVGKLASGIAHELGTPLNVVGARAKMVAAGEASPDESREYARIIVGATQRMTDTVRQLLQFSRRGASEKSPNDLRRVAAETLALLRPLAMTARVELRLAPGAGDAMANVDASQIQQVLTNLLMNAIQAMPDGGAVELRVGREHAEPPAELHQVAGEYLYLRVEDEGTGIPPEVLPHVFEPFFTTKDVGAGTGLGLAVTHGIIRDHGGWITVASEIGKGAVFCAYLPIPGAS
jgi:signal transduction histidine kinase